MAKVSKKSVDYRRAWSTLAPMRCGTCSMFRSPGSCTLVEGKIKRTDVCDLWAPRK